MSMSMNVWVWLGLVKSKLGDTKHTPLQTHNLSLAVFLSKAGQNSNEVRMCRDWFRIDFRLNLHLITEILVRICWRSKFIIVRSLRREITRNNWVNYFKFCPVFDKDCLHFQTCDTSAQLLWRVPIANPSEGMRVWLYLRE